MSDLRDHWERVHRESSEYVVSWFQQIPVVSLELIDACGLPPTAGILDVGGGTSRVVDFLLERGYRDLTVLDVSQEALRTTRQRIGADRDEVQWLQQDIMEFDPSRQWHLWHDRAVFHFLTDPEQRTQYREALARAIPSGGHVIIATFALTGPERCSGQFVMRYDAEALQAEFGDRYELVETRSEQHETPSGSSQDFAYCLFRII